MFRSYSMGNEFCTIIGSHTSSGVTWLLCSQKCMGMFGGQRYSFISLAAVRPLTKPMNM